MKISIIGSGNIAHFMGVGLFKNECTVHQILSKNIINATVLATLVNATPIDTIVALDKNIDVLIIATPDNIIDSFEFETEAIVLHTSGATGIAILKKYSHQYGCIWPVQSITKNNLPTTNNIPLVICGNNIEAENSIKKIALLLSNQINVIPESQKTTLHLAATIGNNFSNAMYAWAQEICMLHQLDFELLKPLLINGALQLENNNPDAMQTGPAIRKDKQTQNMHVHLLQTQQQQELYTLISAFINR
jgi:predicted short-subunit dehydrogenase-like oxidoreductase (DUF2520 family)